MINIALALFMERKMNDKISNDSQKYCDTWNMYESNPILFTLELQVVHFEQFIMYF